MEELIPIQIVIGDRSYRIKIEPADEEAVRGTVKLINDKILEFRGQFAGKDMQDYIAMVLIWLATERKEETELKRGVANIQSRLQHISTTLSDALKSAANSE
jgi:cell division protein ZapA